MYLAWQISVDIFKPMPFVLALKPFAGLEKLMGCKHRYRGFLLEKVAPQTMLDFDPQTWLSFSLLEHSSGVRVRGKTPEALRRVPPEGGPKIGI